MSINHCTALIFSSCLLLAHSGIQGATDFRHFVAQNGIPLRSDGKLDIPAHFKHVKLDIGLSYNAPISQCWLSCDNDLIVFGFEPNPDSVKEIKKGAIKREPYHGKPLDTKYLNSSFFLIPCALGLSPKQMITFYVTKKDVGCSSIYEPNSFEVENVISVPIYPLTDFFEIFPFDIHPVIEYIKIDAQGSDLDIVKSAGGYLKDHVVYITIESENNQYKNTNNSEIEIDRYMHSIGFTRHQTRDTADPTYINAQFLDYARNHNIKIFQW